MRLLAARPWHDKVQQQEDGDDDVGHVVELAPAMEELAEVVQLQLQESVTRLDATSASDAV